MTTWATSPNKPMEKSNQNRKMDWERLISDKRFGMEDYHDPRRGSRTDFQRDFDRLVFSSPFRRLQNKTQVFPLPGSIFVHNRLTHSLEVSSVGKSMANEILSLLMPRYKGTPAGKALESIGEIVAAGCLAHDMGNPPFGHSGEKAIATFFSEGEGSFLKEKLTSAQWADLVHFEGNANALRVLTHQFHGRRAGGFAMTYSMLASIVKYPYSSGLCLSGGKSKFGFFTSERETYQRIATELGIPQLEAPEGELHYSRHPLVYIVEAADDICYEVMDFEDAHKLKIISTADVINRFMAFLPEQRRERAEKVMQHIDDPNEQIAYLRSGVVGELVTACAKVFVDNEDAILEGRFEGRLLGHIPTKLADAYEACNRLSWDKIYRAKEVVDIELAGNRIITFLLEKLTHAVCNPELNYSRLLLSQVPDQYEVNSPDLFQKLQGVVDHVSAMTDVYALNLFRKLNGMSLPAV
jgi:dGTPase